MTKFDVIVSDPPWAFGDTLKRMKKKTRRSAASQYNTMSAAQVAALDVKSIVNPKGCVLALWVPSSLLVDGINVMNSWGFSLKQIVVWVKTKKKIVDPNNALAFGMGRLFRNVHEIALIGTMGKVYENLENHSQRTVIFAPNMGHSVKPEALQDSLDLMYPVGNKLEMFARRHRPGWTCVGNALSNCDITLSIQSLQMA